MPVRTMCELRFRDSHIVKLCGRVKHCTSTCGSVMSKVAQCGTFQVELFSFTYCEAKLFALLQCATFGTQQALVEQYVFRSVCVERCLNKRFRPHIVCSQMCNSEIRITTRKCEVHREITERNVENGKPSPL